MLWSMPIQEGNLQTIFSTSFKMHMIDVAWADACKDAEPFDGYDESTQQASTITHHQ